jgi:PBP1b-binding outer membrane lipoprotein LpoB
MKKLLVLIVLLTGCSTVSKQDFSKFKESNFEWQKVQNQDLEGLSDQMFLVQRDLSKKLESTDDFFIKINNQMQELLATRTEQRFSDIREYLNNLENRIKELEQKQNKQKEQ